MLHRLEIENFYSIREPQVIDLRAAESVRDDAHRLASAWRGSDERVPKVVAIFGPNASGKSNVLRALYFIAWFVQHSFAMAPEARLPFERFYDAEGAEEPTRLAVQMAGIEDIDKVGDPDAKQCRYAYELVIGGGSQHSILSESLHYWPSAAARKVRLFERDALGKVTGSAAFGLGGYRSSLDKILRPNASVIATLAQLQHPFATSIRSAASHVLSNIFREVNDLNEEQAVQLYASNPGLLEDFNREIERVDFGIQALELHAGLRGPEARFRHEGLMNPLPLLSESHGTRRFLKLYPILFHVLEIGGIAVLDELDAAIHPLLLPEILRWFHDPVRNPHDAQVWLSCHNASLLDDLSKEEVLFCEKDRKGRTKVYSLRDIQSVRRNDNYYKKYLGGVYGAVPQIG